MDEDLDPGLTVWSGWDLRGGVDADEGRAAVSASAPTPGQERYELTAVAARGFRPPTFLTRTDTETGTVPDEFDHDAAAVVRQVWSLLYRPVAPIAARVEVPFAVYLLGVNPPDGVSDGDLAAFDEFYVGTHVREVAERRHALRAVPHRLADVAKAPYKGGPRFLTAYELDEASASVRRHVGPPYRSGPDVWQRHTTPWRLWYRRLGPDGTGSGRG